MYGYQGKAVRAGSAQMAVKGFSAGRWRLFRAGAGATSRRRDFSNATQAVPRAHRRDLRAGAQLFLSDGCSARARARRLKLHDVVKLLGLFRARAGATADRVNQAARSGPARLLSSAESFARRLPPGEASWASSSALRAGVLTMSSNDSSNLDNCLCLVVAIAWRQIESARRIAGD